MYKLKLMKDSRARIEARAIALAEDHDQFISELIKMRKEKGLSQEQVGERMGISQPAVAIFERYDANPTLSSIRRYALAVGASLETSVTDSDAIKPRRLK